MVDNELRRRPLEVVYDILKILQSGPSCPTRIMYKANLGWTIMIGYLNVLESRRIVERKDIILPYKRRGIDVIFPSQSRRHRRPGHTYELTERGRIILSNFDNIMQILWDEIPETEQAIIPKFSL